MNKLSKDKRDKLVLTCLGIIGVLGVLYTFVLGAQKDKLATLHSQIASTRDKLFKADRLVRNASLVETQLSQNRAVLNTRQENMAPQGHYYWFFQLLEEFRTKEKFETNFILDLSQPEFIEAGLLPRFPYKAASFGIRLSGRYQEVGRFIADFENTYPFFRVQNIRLMPQALNPIGAAGSQLLPELENNLTVEVRVVTLIKPSAA